MKKIKLNLFQIILPENNKRNKNQKKMIKTPKIFVIYIPDSYKI